MDVHTPLLLEDRQGFKTPSKSLQKSRVASYSCTPQAHDTCYRRSSSKRLFFGNEEDDEEEEEAEAEEEVIVLKPEKEIVVLDSDEEEGGGGKISSQAGKGENVGHTVSKSPKKKLKSEATEKNEAEKHSPNPPKPQLGSESLRRSSRLQKPVEEIQPVAPTSPPITEVKKSTQKAPKTPFKVKKNPAKSVPKVPLETPLKTPSKTPVKSAKAPDKVASKPLPKTPLRTPLKEDSKSTKSARNLPKFVNKVVFENVEYRVGDCVYVRRIDSSSDSTELDEDECRLCGKGGRKILIECDECLGGFHLSCLKPPLKAVPEDAWVCPLCNGSKEFQNVSTRVKKTAREKLLSSEMWAARIERIWKELDGSYWFTAHWYVIPEETAIGRQAHNLKRELFLTNDFDDNEMESIVKHCYVKRPKEFEKATDGDDIYLCEYEYDTQWHTFKRLEDADADEDEEDITTDDDNWDSSCDSDDSGDSTNYENWSKKHQLNKESVRTPFSERSCSARSGNVYRGHLNQLQKVGAKNIPQRRHRHQTDLEKAKSSLMSASSPGSLPCRNREIEEITTFITGALAAGGQCLGRCLYIHGVPGTGKTATVLNVMHNLRAKVAAGVLQAYRFVTINGLKLSQPENLYKSLYEALTGQRVGWKRALKLLSQRFSESKRSGKGDNQPCILLVDELDLLVTRNQSVLYNIFDWPTRACSQLVVIGIANTMDLPEKLLPRIASRMGMQRLCFGPYSHQQLQEIISNRLNGIDAFERQAIEFASRKVAAVSGDARRALELCRRAAEIAESRLKQSLANAEDTIKRKNAGEGKCKGAVGMPDVEAAIHEMFQAPHIQMMKRCSKIAKIFLIAMVHEYHKSGTMETTFEKIGISVSSLCTANAEECPDWDTLFSVGCRLGACRLLLCEPGLQHRLQKLQLNFPSDDVAFALKEDKDVTWASKYL